MVLTIPPLSRLESDDQRLFEDNGVNLTFQVGHYMKPELDGYDSRTSECDRFVNVLLESNLGLSSVKLQICQSRLDGPPESIPDIDCDLVVEMATWIHKLPFRKEPGRRGYEDGNLGCYESARDALPVILETLKRPDPNECPFSCQWGREHCFVSLDVMFKNAVFRIDIFQE